MKRRSYIRHDAAVELGTKPVFIWGYGKTGDLVCRVGINSAGIAVYSGRKAGKKVADLSWEKLVKRLSRTGKQG